MFLNLNHQKLEVYKVAKQLAIESYKAVRHFPPEEKFNLTSQIKRASVSVYLNIAEGASRKSEAERKRFYEIARSSIIEIDAAFELASEMNFVKKEDLVTAGDCIIKVFKMLSGLIASHKTF